MESKNTNQLDIRILIDMVLGHWWWFVVSVIVCLGIAGYRILTTPPVYSRSATLLIKETSARRSATDLESVLGTGGLNSANSRLANEIVAFRSPALMEDVMRRAAFNVNYTTEGKRYTETLFGTSCPIIAEFPGLGENSDCSFEVILGDNEYRLSDFNVDRKAIEHAEQITTAPGDTTLTPVGVVILHPNPLYQGEEMPLKIKITHFPLKKAANAFSNKLSVSMNDAKHMSDVLDLNFLDVNTERADMVLATLIDLYNESWIRDRNQIALATSEFIDDRLASLDSDLNNVDSDISSFKSRNLLPDVSTVSSLYMNQGVQNDVKIQEIENQLYISRYIMNYVMSTGGKNHLIPISSNITNSGISQQIKEYNTILLERDKLAANSSEQNPIVVDMDNALNSMRSAIVASANTMVNNLETQLAALKKNAQSTNARIAESPNQEKYLLSIGRQQKVKESLYLFLLQKREENDLSQAFTAYNTRIITPPCGSGIPVAPAKKKILLIALLLGLALPFGYLYIRETLNTKIRGRKDVENLDIPFLGEIPQVYDKGDKRHRFSVKRMLKDKEHEKERFIVVKKGHRDTINEAFRVLRTNLEFACNDNKNVMLFTSFDIGAGKTFICANLSSALAINGDRILAIDGDLRHASLSTYVGTPAKGLADYLAGKVTDVKDIIVTSSDEMPIDVIPVGTIPPNPAELLNSKHFAELIESMREQYKYIMIDCPPVEIVADTQIIEKVADRTIFVARAGLFDKALLPELVKFYEKETFKNVTLVLNGSGAEGTYYGHYGHYGNYRNYGPHSYYSVNSHK